MKNKHVFFIIIIFRNFTYHILFTHQPTKKVFIQITSTSLDIAQKETIHKTKASPTSHMHNTSNYLEMCRELRKTEKVLGRAEMEFAQRIFLVHNKPSLLSKVVNVPKVEKSAYYESERENGEEKKNVPRQTLR